jgi:hypothetical protein
MDKPHVPASYFEGGPKDLGSYELRHLVGKLAVDLLDAPRIEEVEGSVSAEGLQADD